MAGRFVWFKAQYKLLYAISNSRPFLTPSRR